MVKNIAIIVLLIIAFVSVVMIFDARSFERRYIRKKDENRAVRVVKVIGFFIFVISLIGLYFIR